MNLDLNLLKLRILETFHENNLTYSDILNISDKVLLFNIIDSINSALQKNNINFHFKKFIYQESLILASDNLNLIITPFYLELVYNY